MSAYNIVRMRVKPNREQEFLERQRAMEEAAVADMRANGFRHGAVVKTGERTYCFLAEWNDMAAIVKSRPAMIRQLDSMRDLLEELPGGLGVTDPVSGDAVMEFD